MSYVMYGDERRIILSHILGSVPSHSNVRSPPSGYSFLERFPLLLFYDRDKGSALCENALSTS